MPPLQDPFLVWQCPPPVRPAGAVSISGSTSLAISPGIYSQIVVAGNATLTLSAGVYEIAGGGFNVSGNGRVAGSNVLIYNAGSAFQTGGTFGSINFSGNAIVNLTPATTGASATHHLPVTRQYCGLATQRQCHARIGHDLRPQHC